MKENIEEDLKIVEKLIKTMEQDRITFKDEQSKEIYAYFINALANILSDYKRLQEEFKQVDHECERLEQKELRLEKEIEKLKSDNLEYQRTQNIFDERKYRKKYLEERRAEEPNLLYPDVDEIYERYYKLKAENEELKAENNKLKVIKYDTNYGTETINLIPKSELVKINTNRYMIEIENGKFVDLKQVYQENEELKEKWDKDTHKLQNDLDIANAEKIELQKENEKLERANKCYINSIQSIAPVLLQDYIEKQKIKDKIEELNKKIASEENEKVILWLHKQRNVLQDVLEDKEG